jgi:cytochrome b6-f complex iron-sulfur subunit
MATAGAAALATGAFALISAGFLYPVPRRRPRATFVGFLSRVPETEPLEIRDLRGRKILLLRASGGDLLAMSTVCTHLGCAVYYRPDKKMFDCPCHQGVFDREGNPVSGPPQRPLERYPVEVRDGKVFVQFS